MVNRLQDIYLEIIEWKLCKSILSPYLNRRMLLSSTLVRELLATTHTHRMHPLAVVIMSFDVSSVGVSFRRTQAVTHTATLVMAYGPRILPTEMGWTRKIYDGRLSNKLTKVNNILRMSLGFHKSQIIGCREWEGSGS